MSLDGKSIRLLTFTLDKEWFGVDIYSVREIQDMTEITRIPHAPAFMRGVVNLRGNAVPVMDLRQRFGMSPTERTVNTRIIIAELEENGELFQIGALADSVKEVMELEPGQIDPPPRMGSKVRNEFITGIGKRDNRFILILDAKKLLSMEEIETMRELAETAVEA